VGGAGAIAILVVVVLVLSLRHSPAAVIAPAAPPPAVEAPVSAEGRRHLDIAVQYQRKLWCSDAIEELDRALRADARLRTDGELQRTAIACLTSKTQPKALHFLVSKVGSAASVALETASRSDPNADVRAGAARALEQIADSELGSGGHPGGR
jgi:hypothetical protein